MTASHVGGIPGGTVPARLLISLVAVGNGFGCSASAAPDVARCMSGMHEWTPSPTPRQHTASCAPSATAEAPLEGFAAAVPSQQIAGCCRSGTRTTQIQPQSLRPAACRSTSGGAQQAGGTQTMRPFQLIAVRMAPAALLALQSKRERSAMAAWQSTDRTCWQSGMLPEMKGRQAS